MTWQQAAELLESQEYEQVARLLREQQEAVQRSGQMTLVIMLAAACQLCLTCRQFQADRELHQLGLDKARRRELETRQQIQAVLTMLSQLTSPDGPAELKAHPNYSITDPAAGALAASESGQQSTLFQKVKQLLGFESNPTQTAGVPPTRLDTAVTGSPVPIDQETLAQQLEQFIASSIEEADIARSGAGSEAAQDSEEDKVSELSENAAEQKAPEEVNEPDDEPAAQRVADERLAEASSEPGNILLSQPGGRMAPSSGPRRQSETSDQTSADPDRPSLVVYCLGPFQTYLNERAIETWRSGKGKSIFKYLVNNRQRPAPKEVLMDLFWPEADPDAARNNLNVAIYGLREAFRSEDNGDSGFSHVLYQNESYLLNPELQVWLDVDVFLERFRYAQQLERDGFISEALKEYHVAETLYQGEFLEEDRYEEWLLPQRRQLADYYLKLLGRLSQYYFDNDKYTSCITTCRSMLAIDPCLEETHCRLMRCHYRQGQQHLALRQYHQCVNSLKKELDITPGPKIVELYQMLRHHEAI